MFSDIPAPAKCGVYWRLNISGMYSSVKLQACRPTVPGVSISVKCVIRHSEINRDASLTTVEVFSLAQSSVLVVLSSANSVTPRKKMHCDFTFVYTFINFLFALGITVSSEVTNRDQNQNLKPTIRMDREYSSFKGHTTEKRRSEQNYKNYSASHVEDS